MLVQNKEFEKTCCFYVSEFHLEMILIPYINEKIEENISIITKENLRETVEILVSRMNIHEENKEKILNLDWEGNEDIKENSNIIIIGSREYIEEKNKNANNNNILSVLDCYSFDAEKDNIGNIIKGYKKTLNTLGNSSF